ncbi:MAG: hypothetical protein H6811_07970 [Phycisphaeraceae bacterium]|nr:hypothetical protein [Phycisphaeraceae bacterium]
MSEHVKTLIMVLGVTLLVWIFAEGESLSTQSLQAVVRLDSGNTAIALSVDPSDSWQGPVEFRVAGSIGEIEELRRVIRGMDSLTLDTRQVGEVSGVIRLAEALRRHPVFAQSGATITHVEPPTVSIVVDALHLVDVPVVAEVSGGQVAGSVEVSPPTVRLRLPVRISLDPDARLIARVPQSALADLRPGARTTIPGVLVEIPSALRNVPGVGLETGVVDVSFTLQTRTSTQAFSSIPFYFSVPSLAFNTFDVEMADGSLFLNQVTLTGPTDLISQIGPSKRYQITAEVALSPGEMETATGTSEAWVEMPPRRVRIAGLPQGVVVEEADLTVRVRVRRRPAEPTPEDTPG